LSKVDIFIPEESEEDPINKSEPKLQQECWFPIPHGQIEGRVMDMKETPSGLILIGDSHGCLTVWNLKVIKMFSSFFF